MSIKFALLTLLDQQPRGVNQLRQEFQERTGHTWPINVGQVFQTMKRLHRDGLVESIGTDTSGGGRSAEIFALTDAGRETLEQWWQAPITAKPDERDELVIKFSLADALGRADSQKLIHAQRLAVMKQLKKLTDLRAQSKAGTDPTPDQAENSQPHNSRGNASALLRERHIFELESQLRWLDRVEEICHEH